ncbi:MAG: glycosyltransferase family 2 protein [Paracoccaceae bacterium]
MSVWERYRLRLRRKRLLVRAWRKGRELVPVTDRARAIRPDDILLCSTLRNERFRLPFFLAYYRGLGVSHFLIVDNGSADGSGEYLAEQPDVSLWRTDASYKASRYGADWMNRLLRIHGCGHWALTVDPDEFFVYPFCDTRPLRALTDWLDIYDARAFPAMQLDMYPKGPVADAVCVEGQDPLEVANWFDPGNYVISRNRLYGNLWIQGGPRMRLMFADAPKDAPALNKIPLVKWQRGYAFASSTHMLLPRGLNRVYDDQGGEKPSGCLLHAKFTSLLVPKIAEELGRGMHYSGGREYRAADEAFGRNPDLWCKWSEKYINWRQLEILGLMSKGNWA